MISHEERGIKLCFDRRPDHCGKRGLQRHSRRQTDLLIEKQDKQQALL